MHIKINKYCSVYIQYADVIKKLGKNIQKIMITKAYHEVPINSFSGYGGK